MRFLGAWLVSLFLSLGSTASANQPSCRDQVRRILRLPVQKAQFQPGEEEFLRSRALNYVRYMPKTQSVFSGDVSLRRISQTHFLRAEVTFHSTLNESGKAVVIIDDQGEIRVYERTVPKKKEFRCVASLR